MPTSHFESLETRQFLTATPFGSDGSATLTFPTAGGIDTALPKQTFTDGAGHVYVVATTRKTIQIARLNADGQLDTTWGNQGAISLARTGEDGIGAKALLDTADRLTVLTMNQLFRFTPLGVTDTGYGTNGVLALADFTKATDFAIDSTNHVYVTGSVDVGTKNAGTRARVEAFISRGRINRSFASNGVYDVPYFKTVTGSRSVSSAGAFIRAVGDSVVEANTIDYSTTSGSTTAVSGTGVQSVKLDTAGAVDPDYGQSGVATVFQKSGNESYSYGLRLVGVRSNGAVSLYRTDTNTLTFHTDTYNSEINANGGFNSDSEVDYFDTSNTFNGGVDAVFSGTLSDGREIAVLDDQSLSLLNAGGGNDSNFHSGTTLPLTPLRHAGITAAAGPNGDGFVVAVAGPGRGGVTVKTYDATGHQATGSAEIASFSTAAPLFAAAGSLKFNVYFRAPSGIDAATVSAKSVRVVAANGDSRVPRLISTQVLVDGGLLATYKTTAVDGSTFDAGDNGTYGVRLALNQVRDGNEAFLGKQTLGELMVDIT